MLYELSLHPFSRKQFFDSLSFSIVGTYKARAVQLLAYFMLNLVCAFLSAEKRQHGIIFFSNVLSC